MSEQNKSFSSVQSPPKPITFSSWIWVEAQKIVDDTGDKDVVVFETGYGPSGLPHIGTFQEVARTVMVMRAFQKLSTKKTKLIVFSDDMDALRKVPSNVPNQEMLRDYIGVTLTSVPNPFNTEHKSFAEYNNAKLQEFLNNYGFKYEFKSSTEAYKNGELNEALKLIGQNAEKIKEIVTEDYGIQGGNRKETYCPFIPIDPTTQKQTFELEPNWYVENDVLYYYVAGQSGQKQISILDGNVKCQWKVDWTMRQIKYGVDFEMHGKDLIDSAKIGNSICAYLGKKAPITFMYELFLDEEGAKISKSKGNGLEFSEWIKYAPQESLQWFLYQNPRKPRKLFLGMIPQAVDMFIKELEAEPSLDKATWAIYGDNRPKAPSVTYQMLLNLVNIAHSDDPQVIWRYVLNYQPDLVWEEEILLQEMIAGAVAYYQYKIAPFKIYREPNVQDKEILLDLAANLEQSSLEAKDLIGKELAEKLMEQVYEVGKKYFGNDKDKIRDDYFKMLYQVLMGQETGPRFAHFAVAYGMTETIQLLKDRAC